MSEDESSPAPLRLKPRLRPSGDDASSQPAEQTPPASSLPPAPPPPAVVDESVAERPRLRAKPKLNNTDDSALAASGDPLAAPVDTDKETPLPAADSAPLKLRLQPSQQPTGQIPPPPLPTPPPAFVEDHTALPPPPSASLPPQLPPAKGTRPPVPLAPPAFDPAHLPEHEALTPPDHIVPHISAPLPLKDIEKQVRAPVPASSLRKKKSPLKGLLILLAVLVIVVGGFGTIGVIVYKKFFAGENVTIATLPGKVVDKAQTTVEDRRAIEQARLDAVVEGQEPADARAINTPPPSTFVPATEPAPTTQQPGTGPVTTYAPTTPEAPAAPVSVEAPAPGPSFVAFVSNARIGGVFQGTPARALINGHTVRAGETVDERLGIVFVGLDDTRRRLIFRDGTGAEIIHKF